MTPEKLLDAMQYLPDSMLEQTDRLRQRPPLSWQRWAAVAACLCLIVSFVWGIMGSGIKAENDAALEDGSDMLLDENTSLTGTAYWLIATVRTVEADRLKVTLADGSQRVVLLQSVQTVPTLTPGQKIRLYLKDTAYSHKDQLIPYKIELEEERP